MEPLEPIGRWAAKDRDSAGIPSSNSNASLTSNKKPEELSSDFAASPTPKVTKSISSLAGNWTLRVASGSSCRVQLSNAPSLDLYKASTVRCKDRNLQDINSWTVRDGAIILYSRGAIISHLAENGSVFEGKVNGIEMPITLAR
ncbi:AprI/Inh family metalloprotease inhibitor [Microvirga sp. c23x22]|uniref:AprI/Inh family metalloprotease inhibitor n=1 Tax=Microvirga terricola TaxID=2719797 RepID=A0ABX0V5I2_9HYPH|nr:AprI/Inh family metalloprotease inhibitor [Microvirga terricola]